MTERIDIQQFARDMDELTEKIEHNAGLIASARTLIKQYERELEAVSDRLMLDVLSDLAGQRTNSEQREAALRAKLRQDADARRLYGLIDTARETLDTNQQIHDGATLRRQNMLALLAYETAYLYHTATLPALAMPRPAGR
jgi:hypothetical protein